MRNTSLIAALAEGLPEKGNQRETFFLSQLHNSGAIVTYPEHGDFLVNGKYLFEVGGKNKTIKQVRNYDQAYLAIDDVEYGWNNTIPLWLFGFLY